MFDVKRQASNINDSELRRVTATGFAEGDDENVQCAGLTRRGSLLQSVSLLQTEPCKLQCVRKVAVHLTDST
jgi:hypothetical protein